MRTQFKGVFHSARAHVLASALALGLIASTAWAEEPVVNVNQASAEMLAQHLHGVGESTASRIVAYREANGPFQRIEDLVLVRGIGERLLERNRARLVLESQTGDEQSLGSVMRTE